MQNKNILVTVLVSLLVSGGGLMLFPKHVETIVVEKSVGSVASPDLASPYFSYGTVRKWAYPCDLGGTVGQASTTICTFKAPPSSSSTLRFVGARLNTGTGTTMVLKTYKSASPWLATTQLGNNMPLAANTWVATTSDSVTTNSVNAIFGPSDWLVVTATVNAGGAGTSSPTGRVVAEFTEL
jgi:hypothetical protein